MSALSPVRLQRMRHVLADRVERGDLPGLVTLVARSGELQVEVMGDRSFGGSPMTRDTIFRVASMTKPMLAVAALSLVEECRLRLDDPLDEWLPELIERRILRSLDGPLNETVPAERSITLRDILTCRIGFGCIMSPERLPIVEAVEESDVQTLGPWPTSLSPDEWIKRLGSLPWMAQPGSRWMYHTSFCLLPVLLSRVERRSIEEVMRDRVFGPLGMKDTSFSVPLEKRDRLAGLYDAMAGDAHLVEDPRKWSPEPPFHDEVVSTVDDLHQFMQMLLHGGRHGEQRLLSRPTIEVMTTDQITPEQKACSPFFPGFWDDSGWGFGLSMVTRRLSAPGSPGRFGWDGGFGTSMYADPKEDLIGILLTQVMGKWDIFGDFWTLAYQAIDE